MNNPGPVAFPPIPAGSAMASTASTTAALHLPDVPASVLAMFSAQVALRPFADALHDELGSLTYAELDSLSDAIARALVAGGAVRGTVVVLALGKPRNHILAVLGCLKAGCVFAPVDLSLPGHRVQAILDVAAAPWAILDDASIGHAGPLANRGSADWLLLDVADADAATIPAIRCHSPLAGPFEAACDIGPDDACYLMFTSGSTGVPKAVLGRSSGLAHFIRWEVETFGIGPGWRVAQLTPPGFDVSLRDIFVPLSAGGIACLPSQRPPVDPTQLARWIETERIAWIHAVPSLFRLLLDEPLCPSSFPDLRAVLLAGEPLPPSDVNRWIAVFGDRIRLVNLYGPTETTLAKCFHVLAGAPVAGAYVPVGRAIPGAEVLLLDDELAPTRQGAIGEVFIRTPYRSLGYLRDPEATRKAFVANPATGDPDDVLYRTGDLGRLREDGELELCGRRDGQVKWRGVRLELAEVEMRLRGLPSVGDAAVMLREDTPGLQTLVAYHAPARGRPPASAGELGAHLRQWFPSNLLPTHYVALERLPRGPNGKLARDALASPVEEPVAPGEGDAHDLEAIVREGFAAVLGRGSVGPDEDFFALGGDSIGVQRLRARLRARLDQDLGTRLLYTHTTPAALAQALTSPR